MRGGAATVHLPSGLGVVACGASLNPKARSPNHTVFYLASNEFWGSNAYPDGRPATVTSEPFAQARIGDVTLIAPGLTHAKYSASMDLRNAEVNITMHTDSCNVTTSSIVGATDNLLITRIAVRGSGCGDATVVLASGDASWARRSGAPGGAPLLPSGSGVTRDGIPWIYRSSVTESDNSITASTCYIGGQNNQSQRWEVRSGRVRTANGHRCLWLTENASVPSAPGRKVTISANCTADAAQWQLKPHPGGNYSLQHEPSGLCAALDPNLEFVTAVACNISAAAGEPDYKEDHSMKLTTALQQTPPVSTSAHQIWTFDPHEGYLSSAAGLPVRFGEGLCLTAVEPNPRVLVGAAMQISGLQHPASWTCHGAEARSAPNSWTHVWNYSSTCNTSFALVDEAELVLTTAVSFAGACVACGSMTSDEPSSEPTPLTTISPNEVIRSVVALISDRAANTTSCLSDHRSWWSDFWLEGAVVDLGKNHSVLEGFYYGMRYQMGSGTRPGHTAPGLYGPWQTTEVQVSNSGQRSGSVQSFADFATAGRTRAFKAITRRTITFKHHCTCTSEAVGSPTVGTACKHRTTMLAR